jgi:ribosomal protein S18 acetylase RimI-like enzyme
MMKTNFTVNRLPINANGTIRNNSGDTFIHTKNSNTHAKRFNSAPMYTSDERKKYNFTYEFVGISSNGRLVSYAELYVKSSVIEIYSVYTHPSYRGTGYASKLLKLIKTLHPNTDLWLGVRNLQNETREQFLAKIRLYARAGFTSEITLANKTPAGKQLPFNFIEMKYVHHKVQTSVNVVSKTVNKASALIEANIQSKGAAHKLYKSQFHISQSYLNQVRKSLEHQREYGGAIQFSYSGFKDKLFTFKSEDAVTRHIEGKGGPHVSNFSTTVPTTNIPQRYLITWHTHPEICYKLSGACLAMPSGNDILAILSRYLTGEDTTGINLVFSKEGVYVVRLKSRFMTAVETERSTTGIGIPNMSKLQNFVHTLQQPQFRLMGKKELASRPVRFRNNKAGQIRIVSYYKNQLESIKTPKNGISIFEMNLIPYPSSGGISFNSTLHSEIVARTKSRNRTINRLSAMFGALTLKK